MGIQNQNQVRGLNPGVARGDLEVIPDGSEVLSLSSGKIYVMSRVPPELRPVAGIATVSEGNLASHIQLLARNLGIPNAIITRQNLEDLVPFSGKSVFYAVSPGGTVLMKLEQDMTNEERMLFEDEERSRKKVRAVLPFWMRL